MPARHHLLDPDAHLFSGRGAAIYDRLARPTMGWIYRRVARDVASGGPGSGTVVDMGCGPGHGTIEIARRSPGLAVIGIDPSPDMIERARANALKARLEERVKSIVGSSVSPGLEFGSVALVVSCLSVHHWDDIGEGLAGVMRLLPPGGEFWIYEPTILMGTHVPRAVARHARALLPEPTVTRKTIKLGPVSVMVRLRLRKPAA